MKKPKNTKSLALNAQTIRVLDADKLRIASGGAANPDYPTWSCPSSTCK